MKWGIPGHCLACQAICNAKLQAVVARGLSVRETERLVMRLSYKKTSGPTHSVLDPNIRRLQDDLSEKLGAPIFIRHSQKGQGQVVIRYNDLDELDGILAHFQ